MFLFSNRTHPLRPCTADDFYIVEIGKSPVPGTLRARESHKPFFNVKNSEKYVHITAIRNSYNTADIRQLERASQPENRTWHSKAYANPHPHESH